jgi:hypothetical protein
MEKGAVTRRGDYAALRPRPLLASSQYFLNCPTRAVNSAMECGLTRYEFAPKPYARLMSLGSSEELEMTISTPLKLGCTANVTCQPKALSAYQPAPAWRKSISTAVSTCLPFADVRRMARLPGTARIEATRSNPAGMPAIPII